MKISNLPLRGTVDLANACIYFMDSEILKQHVSKLMNEDGEVELSIDKIKYLRTIQQNRYYWGVVVKTIMIFLKETQGETYTREQVHAINLEIYFGDHLVEHELVNPTTGELVKAYISKEKSSSNMNTKEFTDFIETVRLEYAQIGCEIPDPDPDNMPRFLEDYLKLYQQDI